MTFLIPINLFFSYLKYGIVINQSFNLQIKFKQLLCLLVSLWSLMHSLTIPTVFSE